MSFWAGNRQPDLATLPLLHSAPAPHLKHNGAHSCCKMAMKLAYWDIRGVRNSRNFCIPILCKFCIVRPLIDSYVISLKCLFHNFVMQSSQKNRIEVSVVCHI